MDADGIPMAFDIFPRNQNKQTTLKPLESKILQDFGCSGFIFCSDAGLGSAGNRRFDRLGKRWDHNIFRYRWKSGNLTYKTGILLTKQDFKIQKETLGLQTGLSDYISPNGDRGMGKINTYVVGIACIIVDSGGIIVVK